MIIQRGTRIVSRFTVCSSGLLLDSVVVHCSHPLSSDSTSQHSPLITVQPDSVLSCQRFSFQLRGASFQLDSRLQKVSKVPTRRGSQRGCQDQHLRCQHLGSTLALQSLIPVLMCSCAPVLLVSDLVPSNLLYLLRARPSSSSPNILSSRAYSLEGPSSHASAYRSSQA